MILVRVYVGSIEGQRLVALVETEDVHQCAACGERIHFGDHAVFADPPAVFLHPGKGGCATSYLRDDDGRLLV